MKTKIKTLITTALLAALATLSSCAYEELPSFVKQDVRDQRIFKFNDKKNSALITLRTTNASYDWGQKVVHISYIIDIRSPLSANNAIVSLRLIDQKDFKVDQVFISSVGKNYTGQLKGQFSMSVAAYRNLAGAEIVFMTAEEQSSFAKITGDNVFVKTS